jgi:hypothetical protein
MKFLSANLDGLSLFLDINPKPASLLLEKKAAITGGRSY